jgi:hypothetical protein
MHAPPAFSVGDEVLVRGEPFKLWKVAKRDRRLYSIKGLPEPPPGEPDTRKECLVAENQLIKLKDELAALLDSAGVAGKRKAADDLLLVLLRAANWQGSVPPDLVGELKTAISNVVKLLSSCQKYREEYIRIQSHQIGAGIIDIWSYPVTDTFQVFPLNLVEQLKASTEDGLGGKLLKEAAREIECLRSGAAIIKMPELLKAWLLCLEKMTPPNKRGQPRKEWERQIVWEAVAFGFRYSVRGLSSRVDDPFRDFVLKFYKCVTGKQSKTDLTKLVREVVAEFKARPAPPRNPRELRPIDYAKLRLNELTSVQVNSQKNTIKVRPKRRKM